MADTYAAAASEFERARERFNEALAKAHREGLTVSLHVGATMGYGNNLPPIVHAKVVRQFV